MKKGFDNNKHLKIQSEQIKKRIDQFGDKLYLEFGGKLFDDYHALLDNGNGGLSKKHAPDGIHPVADAYTLMEAEVMKSLKKVVKIK